MGIGPIAGTIRAPIAEFGAWLGQRLGRAPWDLQKGAEYYHRLYGVGFHGSSLAFEPRMKNNHPDEIHFTVTQSECEAIGWGRAVALGVELLDRGAKLSRVDVHFDDRDQVADVLQVWEAFEAGKVRTRIDRSERDRRGRGAPSKLIKDIAGGATAYLGSRQSGLMLRVYRADPLHGEGTGIRWELESRHQKAEELFKAVCLVRSPLIGEGPAAVAHAFWGAVCGLVEFRDCDQDEPHKERRPYLAWFARLIASAERVVISATRPATSLDRKARWILEGVAPSLALVVAALGQSPWDPGERARDYLRWLLSQGADRLTWQDWQLLPEAV